MDASYFSLGSSSSLILLLITMGCYRYCSYSKTFMLLSILIFLLVVVDCCSLLKLLVKNCNNIETHHNNCSCLYHHHLVNNLNRRPLGIAQVYCAIINYWSYTSPSKGESECCFATMVQDVDVINNLIRNLDIGPETSMIHHILQCQG